MRLDIFFHLVFIKAADVTQVNCFARIKSIQVTGIAKLLSLVQSVSKWEIFQKQEKWKWGMRSEEEENDKLIEEGVM